MTVPAKALRICALAACAAGALLSGCASKNEGVMVQGWQVGSGVTYLEPSIAAPSNSDSPVYRNSWEPVRERLADEEYVYRGGRDPKTGRALLQL